MSCQYDPGEALVPGVTFGPFLDSLADNITCPSTYLRPDPGGALIPWLYSLFLLLFHLPACVLRAVRWQSAQYLSLGLAALSIALCIQAYTSTRLVPGEVLVWMPLTLTLDVGAMLQMVVLLVEKHDQGQGRGLGIVVKRFIATAWQFMTTCGAAKPRGGRQVELGAVGGALLDRQDPDDAEAAQEASQEAGGQAADEEAENEHRMDAFICLAAFTLMLMLVILQIYGLHAGVEGLRNMATGDLRVNWCSPAFRDFALAITTGNCDRYQVAESSSNGIGCISLPAQQQRDWLLGTVAGLSATLTTQLIDVALMRFGRGRQCRGTVDVDRPWFSMILGVLTLFILVVFGVFHAARLPPGVTDVVWIYRKDPEASVGRACHVVLKAPGLRGMIIGWTDGLFNGWGYIYHGAVVAGRPTTV